MDADTVVFLLHKTISTKQKQKYTTTHCCSLNPWRYAQLSTCNKYVYLACKMQKKMQAIHLFFVHSFTHFGEHWSQSSYTPWTVPQSIAGPHNYTHSHLTDISEHVCELWEGDKAPGDNPHIYEIMQTPHRWNLNLFVVRWEN